MSVLALLLFLVALGFVGWLVYPKIRAWREANFGGSDALPEDPARDRYEAEGPPPLPAAAPEAPPATFTRVPPGPQPPSPGPQGAWTYELVRQEMMSRAAAAAPPPPPPAAPSLEGLAAPPSYDGFETRLKGDLRVGGKTSFPGRVSLHGSLVIEDDGEFDARLEVFGNVTLGRGSRVTHPIVVHGNLTLGPEGVVRACRVDGVVVLHRGAVVDGALDCESLHLDETEGPRDLTASAAGGAAQAVPIPRAA